MDKSLQRLSILDAKFDSRVGQAKARSLATDILNLDPRIYSCAIVSYPQGSIIARAVRAAFQTTLGSLVQETDGMAGHWAIRAFSAMERLNATRFESEIYCSGKGKKQGSNISY